MDIYYLNSKGVEYITQVLGFEKEKWKTQFSLKVH